MFHVTTRLLLRPFWPDDWEQVLEGACDEGVVRNLARVPWPYREDDARWWVNQPQDQYLPSFAIVESLTGRIVGSCGIAQLDEEIELGYWLRRDAWGQGYATEAAGGLLEIARMLGYRRIVAGHFIDNPASGRVLRKAGFIATGKLGTRFSLARGEDVVSVEHAIDLDPGAEVMPRKRAA